MSNDRTLMLFILCLIWFLINAFLSFHFSFTNNLSTSPVPKVPFTSNILGKKWINKLKFKKERKPIFVVIYLPFLIRRWWDHATFIGRYWGSTEVRGIETKISFLHLQFYLTPLIVTDIQIDRQTEAQTNKNRQIDW